MSDDESNGNTAVYITAILAITVVSLAFLFKDRIEDPVVDPSPECNGNLQPYADTCVPAEATPVLVCIKNRGVDISKSKEERTSGGVKANSFAIEGEEIDVEKLVRKSNAEVEFEMVELCRALTSEEKPFKARMKRATEAKRKVAKAYQLWENPTLMDSESNATSIRDQAVAASGNLESVSDSFLNATFRTYKYHYIGLGRLIAADTAKQPDVREGGASSAIEAFQMSLDAAGVQGGGIDGKTCSSKKDAVAEACEWAREDELLNRTFVYLAIARVIEGRSGNERIPTTVGEKCRRLLRNVDDEFAEARGVRKLEHIQPLLSEEEPSGDGQSDSAVQIPSQPRDPGFVSPSELDRVAPRVELEQSTVEKIRMQWTEGLEPAEIARRLREQGLETPPETTIRSIAIQRPKGVGVGNDPEIPEEI